MIKTRFSFQIICVSNGVSTRAAALHTGIHEQATVELPGVKGCWSLRTGDAAVSDTYLVMSFIGETRILAINDEDELDETEFEGFSAEEQTLVWGAVHVVATSFDPRI